jgi:hypothetical protein
MRRATLKDVVSLQMVGDDEEDEAEMALMVPNQLKYKSALRNWNIAPIIVQLISFIALLAISLSDLSGARRVGLWIDVERGASIRSLGTYPIFATLVPFPAITAIFHLLALLNVDNYYKEVETRGVNRLRWIEYAITNGLMTFSLCTLAGAGGVVLLVASVLANLIMQYFGYLHEYYNHPAGSEPKTLWYLIAGFVPWIQIWVTVLTYYGLNFDTATTSDGVAIIGSLVLSLTFVIPLVWRYRKQPTAKNNYRMEVFYIILSLTAKLFLDWTVIIGTLVGN